MLVGCTYNPKEIGVVSEQEHPYDPSHRNNKEAENKPLFCPIVKISIQWENKVSRPCFL